MTYCMHVHTYSHKQALRRGTPDTDKLCAISILFEPICSTLLIPIYIRTIS